MIVGVVFIFCSVRIVEFMGFIWIFRFTFKVIYKEGYFLGWVLSWFCLMLFFVLLVLRNVKGIVLRFC